MRKTLRALCVTLVALVFLLPWAYAQSQCYQYRITGYLGELYTGSSAASVCGAFVSSLNKTQTWVGGSQTESGVQENVTETSCFFHKTITTCSGPNCSTSNTQSSVMGIQKTPITCPCTANAQASSGYYAVGSNPLATPALSACQNGCSVYFDGTYPAGSALVNGVKTYYAQGSYNYTGSTCSDSPGTGGTPQAAPTAASGVPADSCAAGQVAGEINGKKVCVNNTAGSDPGNPDSNPDGQSSTTTDKKTVTNPDGSTTTTTTTKTTYSDGSTETYVKVETTKNGNTTTTEDKKCSGPSCGPGGTVSGGGGGGSGGASSPGGAASGVGMGGTNGGKSEAGNPCVDNPNAKGCAGTPASIDELYTKKSRTMVTAVSDFKNQISATAIGQLAGSYFNVSGGGSCQPWSGTVPYLNADFSVDVHCSISHDLYLALRVVLLFIASIIAFRIAFNT